MRISMRKHYGFGPLFHLSPCDCFATTAVRRQLNFGGTNNESTHRNGEKCGQQKIKGGIIEWTEINERRFSLIPIRIYLVWYFRIKCRPAFWPDSSREHTKVGVIWMQFQSSDRSSFIICRYHGAILRLRFHSRVQRHIWRERPSERQSKFQSVCQSSRKSRIESQFQRNHRL